MKRRTKKRLSGTKKRYSRRKISGVSKMGIDMQNIIGLVGGAIAAGYLNKLIPATVNDKITAAAKVGLGLALPMFIKNNKMIAGAGAGMIAIGSVDLLKSFGALAGDFDIPVINGDILSGDVLAGDQLDVINGDDDIPVINGDDDDLGEDDDLGADFLSADEDDLGDDDMGD